MTDRKRTPVCELLGIELPIVEAPLSADPRLPAAVSNAGGLGTLGLGWADDAAAVVRETAALTDRPFAGNFVLAFDQHHRVDQALSAGLRVVSLFWGDPRSYVDSVHDAGGLVMHTVGSVEEARRVVGCGVDIVVAQGWEAGGHVWSSVATLPLVPAVVDAVAPVPVIAAGGIGDARGVAAVLALGAQAALLGTRFLLADEMPIHAEYRRRLIAATETDAEWYPTSTRWDGRTLRIVPSTTQLPCCGRPRVGRRRVVDRKRARWWRTSLPANRSFDTSRRRRWLARPVRSNRCPYGLARALRSPNSHCPLRKS